MWLEVVLLAVVQAITEFLPVSSSGHLLIIPELFGWEDPMLTSITLSVALHLGTGLALLAALWSDWRWLVLGMLGNGPDVVVTRRLSLAIIGSTLVIGVIAIPLREVFLGLRDPILAATLLIGFGVVLGLADRFGRQASSLRSTSFSVWLLVGAAQIISLIPGVSRSGITMTVGRSLGVDRASAARFSLLLMGPAVAGAGLIQLVDALQTDEMIGNVWLLAVGTLVAAVVGTLTVRWLLGFVERQSLGLFALYRVVVGVVVLVVFTWTGT